MSVANYLGAGITALLGIIALVAPHHIARFVSIRPVGATGKAEIRATYGGFFLALGVACLLLNSSLVFTVVGVAWLAAAGGRLVSMGADRSVNPKNIGGIIFEGALGVLLVM